MENNQKWESEVEEAWKEEAERRLDEIENGEVETIPGPQAMKELKEILNENKNNS